MTTENRIGGRARWHRVLQWGVAATALSIILACSPEVLTSEEPACKGPAPSPDPTGLTAVRGVAERTSRNAPGYWEADLGDKGVMVHIPAGPFVMGYTGESDAEPEREVTLDDYWIAKYPVTVTQFGRFVEATGYQTDAERGAGA